MRPCTLFRSHLNQGIELSEDLQFKEHEAEVYHRQLESNSKEELEGFFLALFTAPKHLLEVEVSVRSRHSYEEEDSAMADNVEMGSLAAEKDC